MRILHLYNYQDVDGAYRGLDKQVHKNTNPKDGHYTVFSIWDTYRTLHPLLTIIDPDKALNYGRSLVKGYEEGGIRLLPLVRELYRLYASLSLC